MLNFRTTLSLFVLAACVQAGPIPGLFNTGTDGTNTALQPVNGDTFPNGIGDPEQHWQQNGGQAFTFTINSAVGSTIYLPNTFSSMWISPDGNGASFGNTTTPFTLGLSLPANLISANTLGRWAADNCGTGDLNGTQFTSINCGDGSSAFTTWHSFSTSAFVAGLNTFTFNLQNLGGPQAIRVEFFESNITTSDTPEPMTLATTGMALVVLGVIKRKRRAL